MLLSCGVRIQERGDALPSVISKVLSETPEEYDDDAIAYSAGQIMAGMSVLNRLETTLT